MEHFRVKFGVSSCMVFEISYGKKDRHTNGSGNPTPRLPSTLVKNSHIFAVSIELITADVNKVFLYYPPHSFFV